MFMVPVVGLEPTRYCYRGILNPLRLPFRHTGTPRPCSPTSNPRQRPTARSSGLFGKAPVRRAQHIISKTGNPTHGPSQYRDYRTR